MNNARVSVIIPSYKMGQFIGDALQSVAAQAYPHWEVIVVDDAGPEDGTRAIVESFAARLADRRVEYIRHESNQGVAAARNTAMAAATGEFFAFLDADDIWMPQYLVKTVAALQEDPGVAAVNAGMVLFGERGGRAFESDSLFYVQPWQRERFPLSLAIGNFINPSATVVRKRALASVGSFDTDPKLQHTEDYDLWLRMAQAGHRFRFLTDVLVRYRRHPAAAAENPDRMARLEMAIVEKHMVFMNICMRRMLRSLHFRHDNLEDLVRNPLKTLVRDRIHRAPRQCVQSMKKRNFSPDELASVPAGYKEWHQFVRRREFELVMEEFPPGRKFANALELGAGDGGQSEIIAKSCLRLTCTELDTSGINAVGVFHARNIPNVDYQLCDARDLSRFADGSFDLIFSSNLLEHVDGVQQCLAECRRVLASGGVMIHTMPSRHWKFWNSVVSVVVHRSMPGIHGLSDTHWREWKAFGAASWKKEFANAGLRVKKTVGLPFYFGHGPSPRRLIKLGNALGWHGSVAYFCEKPKA